MPKWAVSTHSRPKAAGSARFIFRRVDGGFNTQPPEGGWSPSYIKIINIINVSTHSRPKAAGLNGAKIGRVHIGFNTQPPEGGWLSKICRE